MFLGHFALALASKKIAPKLSLGLTFAAAQALDLLWPILVLAGVEKLVIVPGITRVTPIDFVDYPWSHSLAMVLVWAVLAVALALALHRSKREALVLGGLVASHWFLDLLVHREDLPLYPGGPKLGWHGWDSLPLTVSLEFGLFAAGACLYVLATRPVNRAGRWGLAGLLAFLALIMAANLAGPPPPDGMIVAKMALSMWLLVAWGAWADRGRSAA